MSEVYGNVKHHAGASQAAQSSALGQPEGRAGSPRGVLNERRCGWRRGESSGRVSAQTEHTAVCSCAGVDTRARLQGRVCTHGGCGDEEYECQKKKLSKISMQLS